MVSELFISNNEVIGEEKADQAAVVQSAVSITPQPVKSGKTFNELVEQYGSLPLINAHNHDAVFNQYEDRKVSWKKYSVDQVVMFGFSSEWKAGQSDQVAWKVYMEDPKAIIPYFPGSISMIRPVWMW